MKKVFFLFIVLVLVNITYSQESGYITESSEIGIDIESTHSKQINLINNVISNMNNFINQLESKNISAIGVDSITVANNIITTRSLLANLNTSVENYKFSINSDLNSNVIEIRNEFNKILNEMSRLQILYEQLEGTQFEEVSKGILKYIKEVEDLSKALKSLETNLAKKESEFLKLNEKHKALEINKHKVDSILIVRDTELKMFKSSKFKVGLSAGFNFAKTAEYKYLVNQDSSARSIEETGASGIVSAVLVYHPDSIFNRKNPFDFILNIPIFELGLTSNNQSVSSIFNKEVALGLGLGYRFSKNFSICVLANNKRISKIDDETLKQKKFTEESFSVLDLEKYSTTSESQWSYTVGFLVNF